MINSRQSVLGGVTNENKGTDFMQRRKSLNTTDYSKNINNISFEKLQKQSNSGANKRDNIK